MQLDVTAAERITILESEIETLRSSISRLQGHENDDKVKSLHKKFFGELISLWKQRLDTNIQRMNVESRCFSKQLDHDEGKNDDVPTKNIRLIDVVSKVEGMLHKQRAISLADLDAMADDPPFGLFDDSFTSVSSLESEESTNELQRSSMLDMKRRILAISKRQSSAVSSEASAAGKRRVEMIMEQPEQTEEYIEVGIRIGVGSLEVIQIIDQYLRHERQLGYI